MSKRFGRNRRRRAREAIAALHTRNANLEGAHVLDRELCASLGAKLRDAQDEIKRAKRILGRHCVAFEPEHRKYDHGFVPRLTASPLPAAGYWLGPPDADATSYMPRYDTTPLDVMAAQLHDDPIRQKQHFYVSFNDGTHGYALTNHALACMPRDVAVRRVSEALAVSIIGELTNKGRRA